MTKRVAVQGDWCEVWWGDGQILSIEGDTAHVSSDDGELDGDFKLAELTPYPREFDAESVARWSKTYRGADGLTQRDLAVKLKTTIAIISDMERGVIRSKRVAYDVLSLIPDNLDAII